jgi:pimeloyl-ACP methyl ester carboxylesterase
MQMKKLSRMSWRLPKTGENATVMLEMDRIVTSIELNGLQTAIEQTGAGRPVVLVPSILVRAQTYRRLRDRLAPRFTVIIPEPPGCGAGSDIQTPWTFEQYADWLVQLLQSQSLTRSVLICHSNSAPVGLLAAAQRPDLFSHLIVADATGFTRQSFLRLAVGRLSDGALELLFSFRALPDVLFNAVAHRTTLIKQMRLAVTSDLTSIVSQIKVPTLVAWGRFDLTFPLSRGRLLHQLIPGSKLHICNWGAHDWLVTRAVEFADAVATFVQSTP